MTISEGYNEARKILPIGELLTQEQYSRLSKWLQVEAARSASDTRGMAARTLLESMGTATLTPTTSNPAKILRNISLTSLNLGDKREEAEFVCDMFNEIMGDKRLEFRTVGTKGRLRFRLAIARSGLRTRY